MKRRLLLIGVLVAGLASAEAVLRVVDGYRLMAVGLVTTKVEKSDPLLLPPTPWPTEGANAIATPLITAIPVPAGVDASWFQTDPPLAPSKAARPDLEALSRGYADQAAAKFARRIWNVNFVLDQAGRRQSYWDYLKQIHTPFAVFDPPDHSQYPRYRMAPDDPHAEAWASGTFQTNNLGYRGRDVSLRKPADTFRIVFVGASTTIDHPSFPLSFTDYVGQYLNLWARQKGLAVHFEAINTAREGLQSQDLSAVVEQEIRQLQPDVVVYKEGANQFGVGKQLLADVASDVKPIAPDFLTTGIVDDWTGMRHSALVRRIRIAAARYIRLSEAPRPSYRVQWPAGLDEHAPDLTRSDLPLDLPVIIHDLDRIQGLLKPTGADLAVSSFVWMAEDGLRLDASKRNERATYWYLNGNEVLWPLKYRDIRRFADFQNTVFKEFCESRGVHFVDLARWFPRDPSLFIDGIHISYAGIKMHGWVTFLQLLPLVERRLAAHRQTAPAEAVNAFSSPVTTTSVQAIEARLAENASPLPLPPLSAWKPASSSVLLTLEPSRLRVAGTTTRWAYQIVSPPIGVEPDRYYRVKLETTVTSGAIGVGVLDETGAKWISSPLDRSSFTFASGANKTVQLVVADATASLAAVRQSVFELLEPRR